MVLTAELNDMTSESTCRHEYVRIYQRRLKGLDRRLVATRAYLPVGFKIGDFGHLSEGSYCFCVTCRKRLFPKRSQQEKELARLERQRAKQAGVAADFALAMAEDDFLGTPVRTGVAEGDDFEKSTDEFDDESEGAGEKTEDFADEDKLTVELRVDELEVESVDVEDIKAEGVKLEVDDDYEESCELDEDVES